MALLAASTRARLANWAREEILTDTCDILRETRVRVPSGGYIITYPKHNTDPVPCAVIGGGNPQEQLIAGQEVGAIPEHILLPLGTDILGSDRIKVGSITYHVIDSGNATYDIVQKVLVRQSSLTG
jgi:hypothetical protein